MLTKLIRQLRFILNRGRSEKDLAREIRFHIDMETREHVDDGMSEREARRTALQDFGSLPECQETVRETWGLRVWSDLRRDFQYAFRMIRRKPGFAILTVLTLAIGIGATTAVFSVLDGAILRPLPYRDSEQLVHLWETRENQEFAQMEASYPNFQDWQKRNRSFDALAGYNGTNFTMTGLGLPVRIGAVRVTTNMLSVLGVQPQLGRDFTQEEEAIGNSHVVLITHGFWQRQFGGRPDVLSQTLRLGGIPYTIVGVLPADFQFAVAGALDLLVPLGPTSDQIARRQFHWLKPIGRLKPGVSRAQAETELKAIAKQLAAEHADTNTGTSARLVPLQQQIVGDLRTTLFIVFGAAAAMLCLALANLANLMIAQSTTRQREIAIRTAIGAGTWRIGRQLFAEALVLAAIAGAASLAVAYWTLALMLQSIPRLLLASFPSLANSRIDGRVVLFDFALTLLGGLVAGGVVALRLSRSSLTDAIRSGASSSGSHQRLRSVFTVAEVALAVMLLVGAVVMVQSVQRLLQVNPGFPSEKLVSMHLSLPASSYPKPHDVAVFYESLRQRVSQMHGVERAGVVDELPLTTDGGTSHVFVQGKPEPKPGEEQESVVRMASVDYFETMGIPLISGRTFTPADSADSTKVILINETLARRLFGADDPVGQRLVMPFDKSVWEIAGVVGDVRLADLAGRVRPTLYSNMFQDPSRSSTLVLKTTADPEILGAAVRAEVQQMDPELPVYAIRSMEDTINMTPGVAIRKLILYLVGAFGSIGALMAGIGLYGLMSFVVTQRSKEIGIRIALGAERGSVRRLVLNQAMAMTVTGLLVGIAMSVAGGRLIQSVVFGVTPSNPGALFIVAVIVVVITFTACLIPVRRAVRTDAIIVLRHD